MPASFSSTDFTYDQLVASETVSRGGVLKSGSGVVKRGTILGVEVASGKYTKTDAAAVILAEDADATSADAAIVVYVQGKFLASSIIWPAAGAHSVHTALLQDAGVYLLSAINELGMLVKPDTAVVGFDIPTPPEAVVTVVPTSIDVGPGASGGSIAVTSPSATPWHGYSTAVSWLTVSTVEVTGDGSVAYTIAVNGTGLARTASIHIGDQMIPVTQSA